ncbi:uncharacterized protein F5891DRAFT_981112 [Suillus fuscotomentosus]|uniref:Uncharacterized protein n=1 Tax=Suillus fuscotomentosus TaxID=1912939 RepID=A0AAD4E417_9AGAM|nr:uncharacterized protein F5891DRAFT_981112 [Suillus fuscotomentosus]KAG1899334.1 hypothetical protein F5891DRAFT_981112 [Suillus fuscotomentosus]
MPSSPIRAVANFLQKLANTDNMASEAPDDQLNRASLSDIASTSPATSETRLDHAIISPIKQKQGGALDIQPRTHNERVVNHKKEQKRIADDKKTRREERERRSEALATWKRLEDARKRENNEQCTRYREAVEIWNEEKSKAKLSKQKFTSKKPVLGKLQPPVPRPRFNTCEVDDNESAEDVMAPDEDSSEDSDDER